LARAYSLDLRERVFKFLEKNNDKNEASNLFGVSPRTIQRWVERKKKTGSFKPLQKKIAYRKIDYDLLSKYVEDNPDKFLFEIAEKFSVTLQAVFYALKNLKITRKKKLLSTRKERLIKEKASLKSWKKSH
jgi:putative transposase